MPELLFTLTQDQLAALAKLGRRLRAERNVVFPPGVWSTEQLARYAVTRAVIDHYPELTP